MKPAESWLSGDGGRAMNPLPSGVIPSICSIRQTRNDEVRSTTTSRRFNQVVRLLPLLVAACDASMSAEPDDAGASDAIVSRMDADVPMDADRDGSADVGPLDASDSSTVDAFVEPPPEVPKRVVFVVTPHGTVPDVWAADTAFDSGILAPLAAFRDRIARVRGLFVPGSVSMHHQAPGALLGNALEAVPYRQFGGLDVYSPTHATVDQQLASARRASTPFPSIELAVRRADVGRPQSLYRGPREPVAMADDPEEARVRLGLEGSFESDLSYPDLARANLELIAQTFVSDRARVASVSFDYIGVTFDWLGISQSYHELAHDTGSPTSPSLPAYLAMQTWFASQVARLAELLSSSPTADDGSLLDHTLIVWVTDSGGPFPGYHANTDLPVLLLGALIDDSAMGTLTTLNRPIRDVWFSLARALDVELAGFDGATAIDGLFLP